ncbi:MAG TPA: S8 family peptidase [Chryseosolibacter sp.]|nr:S8 family peptidase [Chryseosolibacter sp.]
MLQVELKDDAIAKSYRSDVAVLFNENQEAINLIGFTGTNDLLIKVDTPNELKRVISRLDQPERARHSYGISAINSLKPFEPNIDIEDPAGRNLEISLINFQNFNVNKLVALFFEETCARLRIQFKRLNYSPDLINYKLLNVQADAITALREFEALREIEFMPEINIGYDDVIPTDKIEHPIKRPTPGKDYPIVGVLDSGIAEIDSLKPWLLPDRFTVYPETSVDRGHGTFVAGIIVYGDDLQGMNFTGVEGCYLYDATVIPRSTERIDQDELVDNIRRAIESKPEIRVWNLSLGTKTESHPNQFSKFGIALDEIQKRYNVIICKSAGNCINFLGSSPIPPSRIAVSADSLRSVVIGSVAHAKDIHDLADVNHPSPFSRVGKGPCFSTKPELVHYGGNAGKDSAGQLKKNGVKSFTIGNQIATDIGTSFSTPRVSAILSGLDHSIREAFDPQLIKALAIHSARYPSELSLPQVEKLRQVGFGIPSSVNEVLFNSSSEITLILQDNLEKGQYIEIMDFPFPESMVDDEGFYYGEIIVTAVASPLVDPNNGYEYCQSNLEIKLGTYDDYLKQDTTKSWVRNELKLSGTKNLLNNASYGSRFKNSNVGDFAKERLLLSYGDKYHPIKKYAVNLEEITPANKEKYLRAPKKWYLKVNGLYRDFITHQAKVHGELLSQEFCLLVTIRDKRHQDIYTEVTRLLETHNFVHSNIRLREQVRVRS